MSAVRLPKGQLYNGKYNIYDPSAVTFQERTPFLNGLVGEYEYEKGLEEVCLGQVRSFTPPDHTLFELANFYAQQKQKGARLPKFSKWVLGMYASDKTLAQRVAELGKQAGKKVVKISTDLVDILRSGDSPHFRSCFGLGNGSETQGMSPVYIAEEAPGIGIAYTDDENGKMVGRWWLHHVQERKTGENLVLLPHYQIGNLKIQVVVSVLKEKGIRACIVRHAEGYFSKDWFEKTPVTIIPVGGYPRQRYHDINFEEGRAQNVLILK